MSDRSDDALRKRPEPVRKATREITGISGNFLENEEEKKSDGQENGN